ncbi:hypothetical protein EFV12PHI1_RNA5 [Enterococcus phage EfV12-phi1]|uniref:Uncharacterized protein n=2 Tax=Schiekvirus TaxID=2732968 RepID=A0A7G9A3Q3_9CAUD|nr:hypothetical protein HOU42_gp107 [Enterococcus phage EfV12-phi1]AYJ73536.1 hypothetical protein EFV12PHI1_RNA5 [Enterococcus phage EfV12-phi1]QNL31242.1 hypothetical protein A2_174 [Enterococcus phage vB_EfaM_A2]
MSKQGLPFGTWENSAGRNYTGLGNTDNGHNKKRMSTRGYYHVALTKEYRGLTERDFELKLEYGKDLVSQYTGVPIDMLVLRKKAEKQTLSSIDSVYYVCRGKEPIGKLSVRAQRRFKDLGLTFVYLEKNYAPKVVRRVSKGQRSLLGQTKSDKRKANRKQKKPKTTN